jgi:Zn-dependent M28 family amino/carboxypeptidase
MVLVNSDVIATWSDLLDEYNRAPAIIRRAVDAGARAILWVAARDRRVLYRHCDALEGEIAALPMAIVAREDALRLARAMAAHPGEVRARLSMANRVGGPVRQENVVGEIRGREHSDEFVILAAHLDSWELGTGALDNGCNAALVIAAARAIQKAHLQPRRTLRFILFTGEEQGFVGSHAYALQHRPELDRFRAMIAFDAGTGRVTGYSLGGRDDIEKGVSEVLAPLAAWGVNRHTLDASVGTDNFDFLIEGVPTLVANQEESNYLANYHASTDTLDKVDFRNLQMHVAIAALTAYGIADRAEPLGPRQSRQEIDALLKRTGMDKDLKALGYWPAWETGARGRQP